MPKGVAVRIRAWAFKVIASQHRCNIASSVRESGNAGALRCISSRQRSSVVEHPIRNRAVVGSIPTAGSQDILQLKRPSILQTRPLSRAFFFAIPLREHVARSRAGASAL